MKKLVKSLKSFFAPSNKEIEHLKARLVKAEYLLTQISKDENTKISISTSLDIWEFLHSEELEEN